MHPDHLLGAAGSRRDLINIEIGSVGGEDGALRRDSVKFGEHLLLDIHVLEHRLDDEVGAGGFGKTDPAADTANASLGFRIGHAALGAARLYLFAAIVDRLVPRLVIHLDQPHREAALGEGEGDASTHGAAADDGHVGDFAHGHILR